MRDECELPATGDAPQMHAAGPENPYRWVILLVVVIAQISLQVIFMGIGALTPLLKNDLNLNLTQIGLIGGAGGIGTATAHLPAGLLTDRFGARSIFFVGQLVVGSMLMLAALTRSFEELLVTIFLAGLGASAAAPCGMKAVMSWFTPRGRGTAVGISQAAVPMAGLLAALTLPAVALAVGLRASFALVGGMILVAGFAVVIFIAISVVDVAPRYRPRAHGKNSAACCATGR